MHKNGCTMLGCEQGCFDGYKAPKDRPRTFYLNRIIDDSGVSGTGVVAWGVCFPDGVCTLRWNTVTASTAIYFSLDELYKIHGHEGHTEIVWY